MKSNKLGFLKAVGFYIIIFIFTTSCIASLPKDESSRCDGEVSEIISFTDSSERSESFESSEDFVSPDNSEGSVDVSYESSAVSEQESSASDPITTAEDFYIRIEENRTLLDDYMAEKFDKGLSEWIYNNIGLQVLEDIAEAVENGSYEYDLIYELTGMSGKVLYDEYIGALDPDSAAFADNIIKKESKNGDDTVIVICGDVGLADNWYTMKFLTSSKISITDLIDPDYVSEMRGADITAVNNEFTVSERGEAIVGKLYTLRAKPENLDLYNILGVNIVSLANNHVYDFGETAFLDTLDYLKAYGICYIGAGKDLDEAIKPCYYIINGRKIALVAGNRSEKYILTPAAANGVPGVLRCYETELMKRAIAEAKENADYVIAYLHWGDEFSHDFNAVQQSQGYEYINAGADLVVGSHTHCLQGAEYYKGKPIVYSLGNFWFSGNNEELGMLKITIGNDGSVNYRIIPGRESGFKTVRGSGNDLKTLLDFFESISENVIVGEDGLLTPGNSNNNFETNITDKTKLSMLAELTEYIDSDGRISVYFQSSDGSYYIAGKEQKLLCASTIKAPYALYLLRMADDGQLSLDERLELKKEQLWDGAGTVKDNPIGTMFSVRELIRLSIELSDNTAYKMLIDRFGTEGFNNYASSRGYGISLIPNNGYGYCNADDMGRMFYEIYEYKGENAEFLINCLLNTKYSEQIEKALSEYNVAQKYGNQGFNFGFHDVAIVYAPEPFVLSIFTTIDASDDNSTEPFRYIATEVDKILNK